MCDVLDLANITEALRSIDPVHLTSEILKSGGQMREMKIISEPGLYSLIFTSRKPEAKAFTRWIIREVLPSIRRTGGYGILQKPVFSDIQLIKLARTKDWTFHNWVYMADMGLYQRYYYLWRDKKPFFFTLEEAAMILRYGKRDKLAYNGCSLRP